MSQQKVDEESQNGTTFLQVRKEENYDHEHLKESQTQWPPNGDDPFDTWALKVADSVIFVMQVLVAIIAVLAVIRLFNG